MKKLLLGMLQSDSTAEIIHVENKSCVDRR